MYDFACFSFCNLAAALIKENDRLNPNCSVERCIGRFYLIRYCLLMRLMDARTPRPNQLSVAPGADTCDVYQAKLS